MRCIRFTAGYTFSGKTASEDTLFNARQANGLTMGQRWRVSNQVNLFNESQFLKERDSTGVTHTFGMDFNPGVGWNAGFTLQTGELQGVAGTTNRHALSINGGRNDRDTQWNSKLEYRRDTGAKIAPNGSAPIGCSTSSTKTGASHCV